MNIVDIVKNMTIEEKVGQMLCFAFHGTTYNEQLKTLIEDYNIGNIIHFARNIENLDQVYKLNFDMHTHAKLPLFIGLDHEGGMVRRISEGITYLPGAMAMSTASDLDFFYLYQWVGREIKKLLFNVNFMPSVDVNNNPMNPVINSRSYSDEPILVAKRGKSAAMAMQLARVMPTAKHFPGHGNTAVDSHVGLPIVESEIEDLEKCELVPFKEIIESNIDGIMISHILYKKIDEKYPSSLSKKVITDLLKNKMGFKGITITDSLTMSAIWNNYKIRDIVKLGINAGNDIIMFCGKAELDEQIEIINAFIDLIKTGEIDINIVNKSVEKILTIKEKYKFNIGNNHIENPFTKTPFNYKHDLSKKITLGSITKVKDDLVLPIKKEDKILCIFPKITLATLVDNETHKVETLGTILKVDELIYDENTTNFINFVQNQEKYDKIILATYNTKKDGPGVKIFNLLDKDKTICVSLRSPYDILYLDGCKCNILTYDCTKESIEALAEALKTNSFSSKLPIKLN